MIASSDPLTHQMGDLILDFAIKHKMSHLTTAEVLFWIQFALLSDTNYGDMQKALRTMREMVNCASDAVAEGFSNV